MNKKTDAPKKRRRFTAAESVLIAGLLLIGVLWILVTMEWLTITNWVGAYAVYVLVASGVTFATYLYDKWAAGSDRWRISEMVLHRLALMGGWPGSLIGRQYLRHKSQKIVFLIVPLIAALLHAGLVVGMTYPWWK